MMRCSVALEFSTPQTLEMCQEMGTRDARTPHFSKYPSPQKESNVLLELRTNYSENLPISTKYKR